MVKDVDKKELSERDICTKFIYGKIEEEIPLDRFPSPEFLWQKYCAWKGLDESEQKVITQDYFTDSNKPLRYYQRIAINRTVEAIAKGQNRILLVITTVLEKRFCFPYLSPSVSSGLSKIKMEF